jgi:hypothetical protein
MLVPILGGIAIAVGLLGFSPAAESDDKEAAPKPKPKPKAKGGKDSKPDDKEDAASAYARGVNEAKAKADLERKAKSDFDSAVSEQVKKQIADAKKIAGLE